MRLFLSFFVCFFLFLSCGCTDNGLKTDPNAKTGVAPDTNRPGGGRTGSRDVISGKGD
jgi:hypothetical protein